MRYEFNMQGLNKTRAAIKAAAFALPAIVMTAQQYGWTGLFVAAAFAGVMTARHGAMLHLYTRSAQSYHRRRQPETPPGREQVLSDQITNRLGMPSIPVSIENRNDDLALTDLKYIYIAPRVAKDLKDPEMRWLLAHEIDHVRNSHDLYLQIPLSAGAKSCAGLGVLAVLGNVTNSLTLPGNPDLSVSVAVSATAMLLFHLATKAVKQEVELRCDSNALRVTGDKDAAITTTRVMGDMAHHITPDTPLSRIMFAMACPFHNHPPIETRLRNLETTWAAMQTEQATALSRRAPTP